MRIQFKCDFRRLSRESYKHRFPGNIPGLAPDGCLKLQKVFDGPLLCGTFGVRLDLAAALPASQNAVSEQLRLAYVPGPASAVTEAETTVPLRLCCNV
jgi:hypothetical protein